MNTRTYCRNSTLAFPKTTDYACALERPAPSMPRGVLILVCAVCALALLAAAVRN